jgi:hypothetical protein
LPVWAQYASGIALLLVALTAGGLSLAVNVAAGLSVGVAVAFAYGLSDCGKMLLPVVSAGIGWNKHTKTAYVATSIVSVMCAAVYLADQHGSTVVTAEHRADIRTASTATVTDLESQLARLQAAADAEAGSGYGPEWRKLNDAALKTSERLADSRKDSAVSPTDFAGSSVLLASLTGFSAIQAAKGVALAKTIAALIVMELLVHLAGAASRLIGQAMTARKAKTAESKATGGDVAPATESQPAADRPAAQSQPRDQKGRSAPKDWTKAEAYAKALEPA